MDERSVFLAISVPLTGFDRLALEGTGMVDGYLATLRREVAPATLNAFWSRAAEVLQDTQNEPACRNARIRQELFPINVFDGLAQNIIFMWYCGQWQPTVDGPSVNLATVRNVSAEAYVQGLVWPAANTHPPGAKQPGFGSWAIPPLSR